MGIGFDVGVVVISGVMSLSESFVPILGSNVTAGSVVGDVPQDDKTNSTKTMINFLVIIAPHQNLNKGSDEDRDR